MRAGKDLEILTSMLERHMKGHENRTVVAPYIVKDAITGQRREFDLMVLIKSGYHEAKIAVECKDWTTPVDVPVVESFYSKCKDNGIHKGVIVCSNGFTEPAKRKADYYGFSCLVLSDIDELKYLSAEGVVQISRQVLKRNISICHGDDSKSLTLDLYKPYAADGTPITIELLEQHVQAVLNQEHPDSPEFFQEKKFFNIHPNGSYLKSSSDGETIPITAFQAQVELKIVSTIAPFRKMTYKNANSEKLADVAVSQIESGDTKGKLMVIWEDGAGKIVFQKES